MTLHATAATLALVLSAQPGAPVTRTYFNTGKSPRYFLEAGRVLYGTVEGPGEPLDQANPKTFRAFDVDALHFDYASKLAADDQAFFVGPKRIAFPGAASAKLLAAFNDSQCPFLMSAQGKLLRIDESGGSVHPVPGAPAADGLEALVPRGRGEGSGLAKRRYLRLGQRVFYVHLDGFTPPPLSLVELPEVDGAHFQAMATEGHDPVSWGTDGVRVFVGARVLEGAEPRSFTYVGSGYAKDQARVFFLREGSGHAIPGADPASLKEVMSEDNSFDAMDHEERYLGGEVAKPRSRPERE